jgi:RNAse (barnase) inhibitor barstar
MFEKNYQQTNKKQKNLSIIRMMSEMVSRNVDILWQGVLHNILASPLDFYFDEVCTLTKFDSNALFLCSSYTIWLWRGCNPDAK